MNDNSEILKQENKYYLKKTDSFYKAYSGYAYIVDHQPLFTPKMLKGFKESEKERAEKYFKKVVSENKYGKQFEQTVLDIKQNLDSDLMPVPYDDPELFHQLTGQGYKVVKQDNTYRWMSK